MNYFATGKMGESKIKRITEQLGLDDNAKGIAVGNRKEKKQSS